MSSSSEARTRLARRRRRVVKPLEPGRHLNSIHDIFNIIGPRLTAKDVNKLMSCYGEIIPRELSSRISDGRNFLLALERLGRIDESNLRVLRQLLQDIDRHDLLPFITLRKRKADVADPVEEYLLRSTLQCTSQPYKFPSTSQVPADWCNADSYFARYSAKVKVHEDKSPPSAAASSASQSPSQRQETVDSCGSTNAASDSDTKDRETCDIRLRVRAEYCDHAAALSDVTSTKPTLIERQFEIFARANTILKTRDLGTVVCDIKFSELTYLDAFWRDYINGSLQDALKTVFITESLQQAVGNEAVRLVVHVDEDDYESGRLVLLRNLQNSL